MCQVLFRYIEQDKAWSLFYGPYNLLKGRQRNRILQYSLNDALAE